MVSFLQTILGIDVHPEFSYMMLLLRLCCSSVLDELSYMILLPRLCCSSVLDELSYMMATNAHAIRTHYKLLHTQHVLGIFVQ